MNAHLNREQRLMRKVDLGQRSYPDPEPAIRKRRPKRLRKQMVEIPQTRDDLRVMIAAAQARMALQVSIFILAFVGFQTGHCFLTLLLIPVGAGVSYLIERLENNK